MLLLEFSLVALYTVCNKYALYVDAVGVLARYKRRSLLLRYYSVTCRKNCLKFFL